jgi:hypothetical protein
LNAAYHYVSPFPEIYQVVDATLTAVAIPNAARVLDVAAVFAVAPPTNCRVSVVIAIVVVAPEPETKLIVVPTGKAVVPFAGIVTVLVAVE